MTDAKGFDKNPFLDFNEEFTFTGATKDSILTKGFNLPGVTFGAETSKPNTLSRKQPDNVNFLYQNYFRFQIQGFDTFNYFCQTVTLPGFGSQSAIEQPTRFTSLKIPSTKVAFDNLEIGFLVDENMSNWRQIQDWMKTIYLIDSHKGHEKNFNNQYRDAELILLNSKSNPNQHIKFKNVFPVSLTGLEFDSTITDLAPFTATASFAFDTYDFVDPESGFSL